LLGIAIELGGRGARFACRAPRACRNGANDLNARTWPSLSSVARRRGIACPRTGAVSVAPWKPAARVAYERLSFARRSRVTAT
jgi:hypothetical protein